MSDVNDIRSVNHPTSEWSLASDRTPGKLTHSPYFRFSLTINVFFSELMRFDTFAASGCRSLLMIDAPSVRDIDQPAKVSQRRQVFS
ncbi:hypothetical protein Tco_1028035 [Tanacetum coccineum]